MQSIWALPHLLHRQGFSVQLNVVGHMGSITFRSFPVLQVQSSVVSQAQLQHGDPYACRHRHNGQNRIRSAPPHTHQSHNHPRAPSFLQTTMTSLIWHNKGFLREACTIIASYFQPLVRIPFITGWLLAALTMWEGFSASTLRSPLLLGHVHLSTPVALSTLLSPLHAFFSR